MDWKVNFVDFADVPILRLDLTNTGCGNGDKYMLENELGVRERTVEKVSKKISVLEEYKREQDAELEKKMDEDVKNLREEKDRESAKVRYLENQLVTLRRKNTVLKHYFNERFKIIKGYRGYDRKHERTGPIPLWFMPALRDCEWEEDAIIPEDRFFNPCSDRYRRKAVKDPNKIRGPFS